MPEEFPEGETQLEQMKKNPYKKQIDTAFSAIQFLDHKSWTNYREELFKLCAAEEKGHRGSGPDFGRHHPNAASVSDCAKMFSVQRIADFLRGAKMPVGKQFLHCQKSAFYAAGIVDEYGDEIKMAWDGLDWNALATMDYCRMVSPEDYSSDGERIAA